MKSLDKFIRYWRVKVALANRPQKCVSVFDIGCDDGYLLTRLKGTATRRDGIDPRLAVDTTANGSSLRKGYFPADVENQQMQGAYDAIFALAVFEHFTENDLQQAASAIARMLAPGGRLILTVPHPFVDRILDVLLFLRLIEGQALEEHHGFDPDILARYFEGRLRLVKRSTFQLGLNNVFVFERA